MNVLKSLFLTGVLAVTLADVACANDAAPTVVRLTGSTAYRSVTHSAIQGILTAGYTYAYTGASLSGASQAVFVGQVNGEDVVIKTSWSGAVAGVQTVSQGITVPFLAYGGSGGTDVGGVTNVTVSTGGTANTATGTLTELPDVAMSDTFQNTTPFPTPVLTSQIVGVLPFIWVASEGATFTNITPQLAQNVFQNGNCPLSLFTGNSADVTSKVFAIGRNPDSGTRLSTFAESGIGVNSTVVQYQVATTDATTVTSHIVHPVQVSNGITYAEGNGGYSSGGTLATIMGKTTFAGLGGYYVSYMGTSDAATATAAGAVELTYNGVPYSLAAVKAGQYTFWGYEHMMYKSSFTGKAKVVADTLATQIRTTDATIKESEMAVKRTTDGGQVTAK